MFTVRDLIADLSNIDEDLKDREVVVLIHKRLNKTTLLTVSALVNEIDANTSHPEGHIVLRTELDK